MAEGVTMGTHFCPECVGWQKASDRLAVDLARQREIVSAQAERIKDLESALRAILAEHGGESWNGDPMHCRLCSPQEGRWPCTTALTARDALGDGDG